MGWVQLFGVGRGGAWRGTAPPLGDSSVRRAAPPLSVSEKAPAGSTGWQRATAGRPQRAEPRQMTWRDRSPQVRSSVRAARAALWHLGRAPPPPSETERRTPSHRTVVV
uniref:Uncharacterized protein n=1 Tax=Solanum lycopersicum TaxID=4081 RepID=A0A494G9V9_SOLLC